MSVIVSPSLLSADFLHLDQEVAMINRSHAQWLHLDVMDGQFAPNLSFGFPVIEAVKKKCTKILDAHFMIFHPDRYVARAAEAGADIMTVHAEACADLPSVIALIHEHGMKAGIAVNPDTPAEFADDVLVAADLFLVMSVFPGFSGQKFIPSSVEKVAALRRRLDAVGSKALIEVDGGINADIASKLVGAGAAAIVCGNYVFKAADPYAAIDSIVAIG